MTPNHTCETCWHYNMNECWRFPPVVIYDAEADGVRSRRPHVQAFDTCGEWGPSQAYQEQVETSNYP